MLQRRSENTAKHGNDEQPHQHARERAAKMKSAVKEHHRQREQAEPEMAAHPRLCAADTPRRHAFARAQECGKNHEPETDEAEHKPDDAASARPLRRFECIRDVHNRGNRHDCG